MPKKETKGGKYRGRIGALLITPAFITQFIFGWFPIGVAFIVAFQKFYLFKNVYVGFDNFLYFLQNNPMTIITFRNTLYYTGLSLALTFLVPILVAIFLMEMRKGVIRAMMILWFIPVASMAGIIIWKWFYDVQYGLFNGILKSLSLPTLRWLDDPRIAMLCMVLPGLIMYGPGLIYIASLQGIPDELYEAAELEGAGFWRKIWSITLPRLRPIIAMWLILSIIIWFQVFDFPYIMTGGGPVYATRSVVIYMYDLAFGSFHYGKGTALSIMLFLVIMVLVVIQRKYFKENIDV